jgi:hypothetical protein
VARAISSRSRELGPAGVGHFLSLLKKSSTSGAETFTRLSVPFFVGKSCSNLDISPESVLEVTTTARFSTG